MRETVEVSGVVLLAQPVNEFDKRLVILTRERGKITAFAHGARRQNNALMAVSNPFVFATFSLYEGRNAYTLAQATAAEYFTELANKQPGVYYGFYFLELAGYYGQEGLEAANMVSLIFVALKAIIRERMPFELIRRVYELRMLVENGDFEFPDDDHRMDEAALYALRFCATSPVTRLFSFSLKEEAENDFRRYVKSQMRRAVDRKFKSLTILEQLI